MRFYTIRNRSSAKTLEDKERDRLVATVEIVLLVFLASFIPALIKLGRPPTSIAEVWVEILVAVLASLYAYARIRQIDMNV